MGVSAEPVTHLSRCWREVKTAAEALKWPTEKYQLVRPEEAEWIVVVQV